MARDYPEAYEGTAPFAFASYCHDDAERVISLIAGLMDAGVNVWYDQGIHAGDEWPEVIAEHLLAGTAFVAFLSRASQDSHNCRREFNLAIQEDKPLVAVILEEFPASPALQMQLAGVKVITAEDYEDRSDLQHAIVEAVLSKMGVPEASESSSRPEPPIGTHGERVETVPKLGEEQDAGPDAEPADGEDLDAKHSRNRRRGKVAGIAVAIVAVLCAIVFATGGFDAMLNPGVSDSPGSYSLSTAKPALSQNDAVEVLISAKRDTSIGDFSSSIQQVKERLDVFVGADAYDLTVTDDKAVAVLPASAFGGLYEEGVLERFITRSMRLSLSVGDTTDNDEAIMLSRRNIEDAAVVPWPDEDSVVGGYPKDVTPAEWVVKITLSEAFADSHAQKIEEWGEKLVLVQDIGYADCYSWSVMRDVDGRSLYVCGKADFRKEALDTLAYAYTHEPLEAALRITVNKNMHVSWEDPASCRQPGEHQVPMAALEGQAVTFQYTILGERSSGVLLDWKTGMKMRLDALRVPYAIGDARYASYSGDTGDAVLFAIEKQAVESCVPQMMKAWVGCTITADGWKVDALYSSSKTPPIEITPGENGTFQAIIRPDGFFDDYQERVERCLKSLQRGDTVTYGSYRMILWRGTYGGEEDGAYVIRDLKTPSGASLGEDAGSWLVRLLELVPDSEKLFPTAVRYDGCWVSESGRLTQDQDDGMEPDAFVARVEKAAQSVVPDARVTPDGDTVWVALRLDVDEDFAQESLSISRQILDLIGTDFEGYARVYLVLTFEKDADGELARVGIDLDASESGTVQPTYHVSVANGRMKPYIGEFKRILASDAYWKGKDVSTLYEKSAY